MVIKRIAITVAAATTVALGGAAAPAFADTAVTAPNGTAYTHLHQGDTSEQVRALQWLLTCRGFTVPTPSHFGPKTYTAVKAYQVKYQIAADGVVGSKTWYDLVSRSQVRFGDRNDCVKGLQVLLNTYREDTHSADLPITGYFGPKTQTSVHNFQGWKKLQVSDIAGVGTWDALLTSGIGE